MKVVQIDGGIGRVISSTGAIRKLAEKDKEKSIILSSWPEVFWFNPHVYKMYSLNKEWLFDDVIKGREYICPEPYHDMRYYSQKHHLSQSFDYLLNGEEEFLYPEIFLSPEEVVWAENFIANVKKTTGKSMVAAYQPFGASFSKETRDGTNRSLSFDAAKYIADNVGPATLLNCSHVDMDHVNVWQRQFTTRELIAVVSRCDAILSIDSSLVHIGAAYRKKGLVMLGGTYEKNVSYPDLFEGFYREGYPKTYFANRFSGFVDNNAGAMGYSEEELNTIISKLTGILSKGGSVNETCTNCLPGLPEGVFKINGCTGSR